MGDEPSSTVRATAPASAILSAPRVDGEGNVRLDGHAYRQAVEKETERLLKEGRPTEGDLDAIAQWGRMNSLLITLMGTAAGSLVTMWTTLAYTSLTSPERASLKTAFGFVALIGIALLALFVYTDNTIEVAKNRLSTKSDVDQMENILPDHSNWPSADPQ